MNQRQCNSCRLEKPLEEFPWHRKGKRHYKCKPCYRAYFKQYREEKPDLFARNKHRAKVRKHGIEPEDYDLLLAFQGNRCAICGRDDCRLVIDHDHATGAVRGLLCNSCNVAMSVVDATERLELLHAYKVDPPWSRCRDTPDVPQNATESGFALTA